MAPVIHVKILFPLYRVKSKKNLCGGIGRFGHDLFIFFMSYKESPLKTFFMKIWKTFLFMLEIKKSLIFGSTKL